MGEQYELQELTGRDYVPRLAGDLATVRAAADAMGPRPRRVVRVDKARPLRPRYARPRGATGPTLSARATVGAYLGWARAAGLERVTVYRRESAPWVYAEASGRGFALREVAVSDFLGPPPAPVTEEN
jgi:hypothetical protein